MSRIGKKPIPMPAGVKYTVNGNTVLVEGPKGKVTALLPGGITLVQKDNTLVAERENDKQAAFHGLARSLVFNAVHGVTTGWTKDLDIVGIGYRAELKGKAFCGPASWSPDGTRVIAPDITGTSVVSFLADGTGSPIVIPLETNVKDLGTPMAWQAIAP